MSTMKQKLCKHKDSAPFDASFDVVLPFIKLLNFRFRAKIKMTPVRQKAKNASQLARASRVTAKFVTETATHHD